MRNAKHAWLGSMRRQILAGAALLLVVTLGFPMQAQAIGSQELINLTNNQRTNHGLTPLSYNSRLAASATAKAQDMLAKGYWAHTSPEGTTPWWFIQHAGYSYVTVGENLARDFSSDSATVNGWMASPTHRANILKPEFRDIGIAVASGTLNGEAVTLVVAHYGASSAAPKAQVAKTTPKATTTTKAVAAKPAVTQAAAPVKVESKAEVKAEVVEVAEAAPVPETEASEKKSNFVVEFLSGIVRMIHLDQIGLVQRFQ